jgi:hypothetical protein
MKGVHRAQEDDLRSIRLLSKAFNGGFKEAEGVMYLLDNDVKAFELFINYIYRDRLPQYLPSSLKAEETHPHFEMTHLYPFFFLAEKYCINEFKDKVMDALQDFVAQHHTLPSPTSIIWIYNNTHEGSKLRLYSILMGLREQALKQALRDDESEAQKVVYLASAIPDFAGDYLEAQFKYWAHFRPGGVAEPAFRGDKVGFVRCFFHTHAKGEVCHLEGVGFGTK